MYFKDSLLFLFQMLGAEFLILGSLYVSCILARRLLGRTGLVLGWLGAAVVGMWLATAGFHLLLLLHQFNLPAALLLVGSLVAGARLCSGPFDLFWRSISREFGSLASLWRRPLPGPYRWLAYLFLSLVILVLIRAATLPPLGWDALTYHGVKAGLWVQGGGEVL